MFEGKEEMKLKERHRVVKGVRQKLCLNCQKWKPLDLFYKGSSLDGLQGYCKRCMKKRYDKYRQKMKDLCFEHYGGYVCAHCSINDKDVLTLNHINDDGAKMKRIILQYPQVRGYTLYRWLVVHDFPPKHKLQILCANCQLKKEKKRRKRDARRRTKNL